MLRSRGCQAGRRGPRDGQAGRCGRGGAVGAAERLPANGDVRPGAVVDRVPRPGPLNEYDTGTISGGQYHGYMHVRNVRSAALADGRFEATLRTADVANKQSSLSGLRIIGYAGSGASELFIGESPSLQATRLKGLNYDTQTEAVKHFMRSWSCAGKEAR